MTDEEILAAADRIKRRRRAIDERDSLASGAQIMVRWTRPNVQVGSSVSIPVSADDVRGLVDAHYAKIIDANKGDGA